MKTGVLLFRLTAAVVFIQLALGGLLTFDFIGAAPHIIVGFIVFGLAIATMVFALITKPAFKPIQRLSIGLVVLLVVQIILGFATLSSGSAVIAWVHLLNALAIYGMAIAGTFLAIQWNRKSNERTVQMKGPQRT
jgi:heme A synthase